MLTESEQAHLAELERRIDAPRPKRQPGIPNMIVVEHGVKRESHGYPVSRRLPTIEGPYTHGTRDGKPVLIDSKGAHFEPMFGRRIVANRKDEEKAVHDGVAERE